MPLSTSDSGVFPWAFAFYIGVGLPVLGWFGASMSWAVLFITFGILLVLGVGFCAYKAGTMVVVSKDRQRRAQLSIASIVLGALALAAVAWW